MRPIAGWRELLYGEEKLIFTKLIVEYSADKRQTARRWTLAHAPPMVPKLRLGDRTTFHIVSESNREPMRMHLFATIH
jgi:hypothetical protein